MAKDYNTINDYIVDPETLVNHNEKIKSYLRDNSHKNFSKGILNDKNKANNLTFNPKSKSSNLGKKLSGVSSGNSGFAGGRSNSF